MYIHSDDYRLSIIGETKKVEKKDFWNGTAVFMEIDCDIDVNPEEISEGKTYLFDMYNEYYDDNIDDLW